jgi:hypothetical protein
MGMIEFDLEAGDPLVIVSSAAVDQDWWNANTAAATAYAAQYGLTVDPGDYAPDAGTVERTVASMGDFQAWVQSTSQSAVEARGPVPPTAAPPDPTGPRAVVPIPVSAPVPAPGSGSGPSAGVVAVVVVGVAAAALSVWALLRKS